MDNASPLHPALVHLPLGIAMIMPFLTGFVYYFIKKGKLPDNAWVITVFLQLFLVIGAFASLQSGERDEEFVEKVLSEELIEQHEDIGKIFMAISAITMIILAAGLMKSTPIPLLRIIGIAATLAVLGTGMYTGKLGGELVYAQGGARAFIQKDAQEPGEIKSDKQTQSDKKDDDDD